MKLGFFLLISVITSCALAENISDIPVNLPFSKVDSFFNEPEVVTEWSTIKGFTVDLLGTKIAHFLGIPYAQPPIGRLRFKKPRPLTKPNEGTFRAKNFGHACMQHLSSQLNASGVFTSEDCLTLNVYTPLEVLNSGSVLPVLAHIHGSAFSFLSTADPLFYGGYLAGMANTVLVTFNYRLGSLGLMYAHDEFIPANLALYDQALALTWIRDNIAAFGGNPNRVTLSGHSSGAAFATLHLFSTQSRYLYRNLIILSGQSSDRGGVDSKESALTKTLNLVSKVGCLEPQDKLLNETKPRILTKTEVDCLMKIDASELIKSQPEFKHEGFSWNGMCQTRLFLPTYGDRLLPASPDTMLAHGDHRKDMSILMGRVPVEHYRGLTAVTWNVTNATDFMRREIKATLYDNSSSNVERILEYYFHDCKDRDLLSISRAILGIFNDICWHCPSLSYAKTLARTNRIYSYHFSYKSEYNGKFNLAQLHGAYHTEDISLLFGWPFKYAERYSEKDKNVARYMVNIWSNFLKTGSGDWPRISRSCSSMIPYHQQITGLWNQKKGKIDDKEYICSLLV